MREVKRKGFLDKRIWRLAKLHGGYLEYLCFLDMF